MTNTQIPHHPDQDDAVPEESQSPGSAPLLLPQQPDDDDEPLYLQEDEEEEQNGGFLGDQYAAPFQLSNAMPTLNEEAANDLSGQIPPLPTVHEQKQKKRKIPPLLIVGLATVAVVLILTVVMTAFAAQTTPRGPATTTTTGTTPLQPTAKPKPMQMPVVVPTPTAKPAAALGGQNGQATSWASGPLPDGWLNAGLTKPDEVEANRTSLAFTDREMELDFRNAGTRNAHAGTFTAALFILSPAAKVRFAQNDVRVINNALFDRVAQQKLIEAAVDATPKVVKFQIQGNQQFAWIDVAFHLWQSRIDPNNANLRIEGLDTDQGTNQPRIHHMTVLLLRVPPADQGPTAPMGGTGWLVSNYGLDLPGNGLPDIVQPA